MALLSGVAMLFPVHLPNERGGEKDTLIRIISALSFRKVSYSGSP